MRGKTESDRSGGFRLDLQPICEATKPLTHSAPALHWWLGLNAAEQGAWIGGIGGVIAAVGAFAAALVALKISKRDAMERQTTREADRSARAYVLAAYILTDVERIAHRARMAAALVPDEGVGGDLPANVGPRMVSELQEMDASRIVANLMHLSDFPQAISGALATAPAIVDAVQTLTIRDFGQRNAGAHTVEQLRENLLGRKRQLLRLAASMDEFLVVYRPQFVANPDEAIAAIRAG